MFSVFSYNSGSTTGILEPTMSDTAQDVDQLTRQTADLSSDSLPRRLSLNLDLAQAALFLEPTMSVWSLHAQ